MAYSAVLIPLMFLTLLASGNAARAQISSDDPSAPANSTPVESSKSQTLDDGSGSIEDLINEDGKKELEKSRRKSKGNKGDEKEEEIKSLVGLNKLSDFSDISVIQKRFLPKTGRFQVFAAISGVVNNPWYNGFGINTKFAYSFTETWALELAAQFYASGEKQSAKDLLTENGVSTTILLTTKSYFGGDIVWSPIYGKISYREDFIVPYDTYFSLGGGSTTVNQGVAGATIHAGFGQLFSLTKSSALRWDMSLHNYAGQPTSGVAQSFNDVFVSVGFSFFFPEAKYR